MDSPVKIKDAKSFFSGVLALGLILTAGTAKAGWFDSPRQYFQLGSIDIESPRFKGHCPSSVFTRDHFPNIRERNLYLGVNLQSVFNPQNTDQCRIKPNFNYYGFDYMPTGTAGGEVILASGNEKEYHSIAGANIDESLPSDQVSVSYFADQSIVFSPFGIPIHQRETAVIAKKKDVLKVPVECVRGDSINNLNEDNRSAVRIRCKSKDPTIKLNIEIWDIEER